MAKFRKKPMVIDAVRLTRRVTVHTLEGDMVGEPGDWLITGVNGEQYPCKDDVFQKTYEPVVEPPPVSPILPSPDRDPWKPDPRVRWTGQDAEFPLTYGSGRFTVASDRYQVWN